MFQAKLMDILRSPSSLLAIIGLTLLNLAREAHRYPVLASVNKMGFISFTVGGADIQLTTLISLAALIIAAFGVFFLVQCAYMLGAAFKWPIAELNAVGQALTGTILVGDNSTLTLNLTDSDQAALLATLKTVWANALPDIVLAADDAAFEAAYQSLVDKMEQAGMGDMEKILTERYWKYADQLHEDFNAKWEAAVAR